MKVTKRPANVLLNTIQMMRNMAQPIKFDLDRALEANLHSKKLSRSRRQRHKIITKYVENEEGLTIPNPDDPVSYSPMGACVHAMKAGANYREPAETEPDLGSMWDSRMPISSLKWMFGFATINKALSLDVGDPKEGRLDIIRFLLENKVIELDMEADRQKAVEMGLIKVEIPTFGDD